MAPFRSEECAQPGDAIPWRALREARAILRSLDLASSTLTSLTRLMAGARVARLGPRPAQSLAVYEFESCPFCRKVREALCVLDLEVRVFPCPKGGRRFRPVVAEAAAHQGGRVQFPYLVDPNTGKALFESDDIVHYLFETYGARRAPLRLRPALATATAVLAGLWRPLGGTFARASRAPAEPLALYGSEASPGCRLVRESLCALELPYRLHNAARGGAGRAALEARAGRVEIPYLEDPNTGAALAGSSELLDYLEREYAR